MYNITIKNKTENKTLQMFLNEYPDLTVLKGNSIPDVKWVKKNMKNQTVLIINAKNPELPKTDLGNFKTIEFCLIKGNKTYWIDVQHLLTPSNIAKVLVGKITDTEKCKDIYLFPVDGNGYTNSNMLSYHKVTKNKYYNAFVFRLEHLFQYIP